MDLLDSGCYCIDCAFSAYGDYDHHGLECMRYPKKWAHNKFRFVPVDEWSCCGEFKRTEEEEENSGQTNAGDREA